MIPAPRRALEQAALVRTAPFQLPWTRIRFRGRPVIGDELLLQYALRSCSVIGVELTLRQARELLVSWKAEQEAVTGRRDEVYPGRRRRRTQQVGDLPHYRGRADDNRPHP